MEYFGFASGSSKTGPSFPYMPESVLNSYPSALLEHPAVPTAAGFLNIEAPDGRTLLAAIQTWADRSLALLDKPAVQALGVGLSASLFAYAAWRISQQWNDHVPATHNIHRSPLLQRLTVIDPPEDEESPGHAKSPDAEALKPVTTMTQRQLTETRAKLDGLRYQLNELEGEKDMLAAEVAMRKKIVAQLQGEIHVERDKRRQAELKMEMMEWENTHLRRLRKEVAAKEVKIDELEASLKEREADNDKLFQENVILPKTIAAARAKEYEALNAKVQRYEMNAVWNRAAAFLPSSSPTSTMEEESVGTGTGASVVAGEWDRSPSPTGSSGIPSGQVRPLATGFMAKARDMLYSTTNWSNCTSGALETSAGDALDDDVWPRSDSVRRPRSRASGAPSPANVRLRPLIHKNPSPEVGGHKRWKRVGLEEEEVEELLSDVDRCSTCPQRTMADSSSCADQTSVLRHFRSLLASGGGSGGGRGGRFSPSASDCDVSTVPASPAQLADVMPSPSAHLCSPPGNKANNCCQEDGDVGDDDVACPSLSDGHSSVFMSASCGSDSSNSSDKNVSERPILETSKRRASPSKVSPSRCVVESRRGGSRSRKPSLSCGQHLSPKSKCGDTAKADVMPPQQEVCHKYAPPPPRTDSQTQTVTSELQYGRARQKHRPRKSRSKLTANVKRKVPAPETMQPPDHGAVMFRRGESRLLCENHESGLPRHPTGPGLDYGNNNSAADTDSEESWIVITPAK